MSDIDDFLSNLAKGSSHIISSPKTIDDLQAKGLKLDKPVIKATEEVINELFDERKKVALSNINKLPNMPQVAIPTIGFLYDEIRESVLFGLNGAAISLSAILVEFALKHAIVRRKSKKLYDEVEWDRVENIELGPTINEAHQLHIINDEAKEALINFKDVVRNPYLHYNIKKITKDVGAKGVKKVDTITRKVEIKDLAAKDNPVLWGLAKKFVDRERVLDAFRFVDTIVRDLFENKI